MRLTLEVKYHCHQAPVKSQRQQFDCFPITVGRSTSCDFTLEDKNLYVSANHATISKLNSRLIIRDTSANGVYINDSVQPVGRDNRHALAHSDMLTIGDFTLMVSIELEDTDVLDETDILFTDFTDNHAKGEFFYKPSNEVDASILFSEPEQHWAPPEVVEIDELLSVENHSPCTPSSHKTPKQAVKTSVKHQARSPYDKSHLMQQHGGMPASCLTPQRQFESDTRGRSLPEPTPNRAAINDDDIYLLDDYSVDNPPTGGQAANSTDYHMMQHQVELAALLDGAGLRHSDFCAADALTVLNQAGHLLAQMTSTIMTLLSARGDTYPAGQSSAFLIAKLDNNPLKFSKNSADAINQLLNDEASGYQSSETALREAADELHAHHVATVDNMRASLAKALEQMNPEDLKHRLAQTGGLSASLPITREAKLWALFQEHYAAIRHDLLSQFDNTDAQDVGTDQKEQVNDRLSL